MKRAIAIAFLMMSMAACKDAAEPKSGGVALEKSVSGRCSMGQTKCLQGSKAAFCDLGEWRTFNCPDCNIAGSVIGCSAFTPGDACSIMMKTHCSPDARAMLECDLSTKKWVSKPCPTGCKGDMASGLTCG
jgi:hypothetical protein